MGSLTQGTCSGGNAGVSKWLTGSRSPRACQSSGPRVCERAPLQATTEYIMKDWDGGTVALWSDKWKTLILQNFSITVRMTLFIAKVDEVSGTLVTRRCLFLITEV